MEEINKYNIVIIDSGVLLSHRNICNENIILYQAIKEEKEYKIVNGGEDKIGHGTAITAILQNQLKNINITIYSFQVLEADEENNISCNYEKLIFTLEYIFNNIECDIIHMSCGVNYHNEKLKEICDLLTQKGIIFVSAFNNEGSVSYPAAYPNIIGVDASLMCISSDDFVVVKNSIVNLKAKGGNQRVAWVKPLYIINQGSSFAAPYVTAQIIKFLFQGIDKANIMKEFEKIARYIYNFSEVESYKKQQIKYKNVSVFPYNKEMHSLVNFRDLLEFNLCDIYDIRESGKVGKDIYDIDGKRIGNIKNVDNIDFNNIDTLIIGHANEMEIYAKKEYKKKILTECLNNNINVYSFDSYLIETYEKIFKEKGLLLDYPEIKPFPSDFMFGKIYKVKTPVLAIFGTTMQQGKFSLQLSLRRKFIRNGYKVGQLSTEPTGKLFGCEEVYPFGYAKTVEEYGEKFIQHVNFLMHKIDVLSPDIIITGSQSGTTPLIFENIANMYTTSIDFLLGIQPDAVILCVNIFDSIDYIIRTVNVIKGIVETEIITLALFPYKYPNNWFYLRNKREHITEEEINKFKKNIFYKLGLEVKVMDKEGIEEIFEKCIDFFSA